MKKIKNKLICFIIILIISVFSSGSISMASIQDFYIEQAETKVHQGGGQTSLDGMFSVYEPENTSKELGATNLNLTYYQQGSGYVVSHAKPSNYHHTVWYIENAGKATSRSTTSGSVYILKDNSAGNHSIKVWGKVYKKSLLWGSKFYAQTPTRYISYNNGRTINLSGNSTAYEGRNITVYNSGSATGVKWSAPSWLTKISSSDKQVTYHCGTNKGLPFWSGYIVASANNATTKRIKVTVYADKISLNIGGNRYFENGQWYYITEGNKVNVSASTITGKSGSLVSANRDIASLSSTYGSATLSANKARENSNNSY